MVNKTLITHSGRVITLNDQQFLVLESAWKWLNGDLPPPEHPEGIALIAALKGFAGTGKTTIVKELLRLFKNGSGRFSSIVVSAPTHAAKKEIAKATGVSAKTIQSLLGLSPEVNIEEYNINKPVFSQKAKPTIGNFTLIPIDEASMINKDLFEMLIHQAQLHGVKILFIGDVGQLPPVKESISLALESNKIGYKFQLDKVERQSDDNPLMFIYDKIRSNFNSQVDLFEHKTHTIIKFGETHKPDKTIGIEFTNDLMYFGGKLVTMLNSKEFYENSNYVRMLAWTNSRVKFWNNAIRQVYLNKNAKSIEADVTKTQEEKDETLRLNKIVLSDELLIAYKNYGEDIVNSAEYRIQSRKYYTDSVSFGDYIEGKVANGRLYSVDIKILEVIIADNDFESNVKKISIIEPTEENYTNFYMAFEYYVTAGKKFKRWPDYFRFKEKYMLITDLESNGKVILNKDFDYAYATTIHKSQGKTYTNIFIDEDDIDRNINCEERNKLKYVAFSRPTDIAYILTNKTI